MYEHTQLKTDRRANYIMTRRKPITTKDIITISGRYLYYGKSNERFYIKGIAFPLVNPSVKQQRLHGDSFTTTGWNSVLEQLANDTDINTIRLYDVDCSQSHAHYSSFFQRAAELGIYILLPLTTTSGDGVLYRDLQAPKCYKQKLYNYGTSCLDQYATYDHPNILGGVVGNEVMNSLNAWYSAPCVKAYLNDFGKIYAK